MLLEFFLAVVVIEITPGPNLGHLAALSATRGRAAGLAATAGAALGLSTHAVAAALGIGVLITADAWAYELLRWVGVAFLVGSPRRGGSGERDTSPADALSRGGRAGLFWRGYRNNALNPKPALFFVTVVLRFVEPGHHATARFALLGTIYVGAATVVRASVVPLAAALRPFLVAGDRHFLVRRGLSAVLLLIAVRLAWGTRR